MVQSAGDSASSGNSSANEGGDDQGGGAVDYGQILQQQESRYQQQSKTVADLQRQLGESTQVIGRVKKAFVGDDDSQQADPYATAISEHEQLMDYFLQQGLEAERLGKGIPLTVTLATKMAQNAIEGEKRYKALMEKFQKLEKTVSRHDDPEFQLTDRATSAMEGMVRDGLASVYGAGRESEATRDSWYGAICNRISDEIRDLMKNEPRTWDEIRRNPAVQRRMVQHFFAELMPPKARQILEHDRLVSTPMDVHELHQAFRQAQEGFRNAEDEGTQEQFRRVLDELRQDIISHQLGGKRSPQNPSLNQLLKQRAYG